MKITDKDLPGLFQSADTYSQREQKKYFTGIKWYLVILVLASSFSYISGDCDKVIIKIITIILFFITLYIMISIRVRKPDKMWYNGRSVAESVKTRSWRWMMRAEPYEDCDNIEKIKKAFINDLITILKQNANLFEKLGTEASIEGPISESMYNIRELDLNQRFDLYNKERIDDQAIWYKKKAKFNAKKATLWFYITIVLHVVIIILLIYNVSKPELNLPVETFTVAASSVLSWLQAKKHNELSSSYSLTLHEIVLLKSEISNINTENDFSDYVMNCENAFSREHTQWFARKKE